MQARPVRHTSELRACALSVIPSALSVIPAPPPSFLRVTSHSRAPSVIPAQANPLAVVPSSGPRPPPPSFPRPPPSFPSHPPAPHSRPLSVIPAPPSVIPAQAGIQASLLGSRTAPMLDGLPQVRAPPRAAWWPVGGMEASGGPAVEASEQARCSPCPSRRDRFDTLRSMRPLRHSAPPSVIPAPPSVIPAPPPSFLRPLRHSRNASGVGSRRCRSGPSARSGGLVARPSLEAPSPSFLRPPPSLRPPPLRPPPSFLRAPPIAPPSVIPAPPSVIPAQAGIQASWVGSRTAPMLDGLRQVRAPAPAAWWPVRGMEASGGLQQGHRSRLGAARVHPGEIGSTHFGVARMRPLRHSRALSVIPAPPSVIPAPPSVIPPPSPSFLLRAPPSVIPAQAGIQASWVGSKTAPMLDGLPQVRAPPPAAWWPVGGMEASGGPGWSLGFLPAQE